jgi:hypothetical protein
MSGTTVDPDGSMWTRKSVGLYTCRTVNGPDMNEFAILQTDGFHELSPNFY